MKISETVTEKLPEKLLGRNMYLSDHFHITEASKDALATRLSIDNQPVKALQENLYLVAQNILEPIRDEYGEPFSPKSWYRSAELNRMVGAKPDSLHRQGLAVDIELLGWDNDDFAHWCAEYLEYDRIILEYYNQKDPNSGWVHIQIMPDARNHRREFIHFDGTNTNYLT